MNGISELVVREELSVLPSGDGPQAVCERTKQNRNSDPCPVRGTPPAQMLELGLFFSPCLWLSGRNLYHGLWLAYLQILDFSVSIIT